MVLEVEQTFNEYVTKEVVNAVYYVSGLFTMVTGMCEYSDEEDIARVEGEPSKSLMPKKEEKSHKAKGLFALSFDKIPCDEPIKPCQFRTGRRYIQPDNFPEDDELDHYLGIMQQLSSNRDYALNPESNMLALKTDDSNLSFDFASEDHLEFQLQCEYFMEFFPQLDGSMLQALKSYYPHQVEFLKNETLSRESIEDYFTLPNGLEDIATLEEMLFYIRALAEDGKDLATKNPQITPKEYELFLESHGICDSTLALNGM